MFIVSCTVSDQESTLEQKEVKIGGNIPFNMPVITEPVFPDTVFNILDYGAVEGGKVKNTEAIAKAIEACNKAGGGRVLVPPGKWLSGAIHLKSNVDFHVSEGSEILFSPDPNDYLPVVFTRHGGVECYNYSPLVYAYKCRNIAITGKGVFNGQGVYWWHWATIERTTMQNLFDAEFNGIPVEERIYGTEDGALRPQQINLVSCSNVLLEDYTSKNTPFWNNHLLYCNNVVVRNIRLKNPYSTPNTDGINIESSNGVYMTGIYSDVGDDGICIKSGVNEDGWRVNKPTENIVIENCFIGYGHGGTVFGSEMSGGIRNVLVRNCTYDGTLIGMRIKSMRGRGGYVKNIWVQNITMKNIKMEAVRINMYYQASSGKSRSQTPPVFENINISDINCNQASDAIIIKGMPEKYARNIDFKNITINSRRGVSAVHAKNILFDNVNITTSETPVFSFNNCDSVRMVDCNTDTKEGSFIQLEGDRTTHIDLSALDPALLGDRLVTKNVSEWAYQLPKQPKAKKYSPITSTFIDKRDGRRYKSVKIGDQVWMAEDLKYKTKKGLWVLYNDIVKDSVYLYNWETAKNVCPDGWHIPTDKEWKKLKEYISDNGFKDKVGYTLKAKDGWHQDGNGIDRYGFNALPNGYVYNYDNSYHSAGGRGIWWSTDIYYDAYRCIYYLANNSNELKRYGGWANLGYSVRCIKNSSN